MPTTSLVIVESPAKCKKIESYLGPGYKVIASFGHLRNIPDMSSIDISNGFKTKYELIQEPIKLTQIEKIRKEIAAADDVIIATDDDREGEAIGWHLCDLFGLSIKTTKRIIFHEITETAIQSAISHPKRINMQLVYSQQTRQILDMLVGYTISPILWNYISKKYDKSLSAGRCQTPALRLVYENYLEIKNSPGKLTYNTVGYFTNLNLLFELNKQFDTKEQITRFLELCKEFSFLCNTTSPKKVIKKSPEPLTTSNLQQLASNEMHLSPKDTMKYAQQLYEAGYITYMRTDSKKYSMEFIEATKSYISTSYGEQYISQNINNLIVGEKEDINDKNGNENIENDTKKNKKTKAEKKGIPKPQEAHEAIRPVKINIKIIDSDVEIDLKARKLYEIIWKRTLESCMASAQYNSVSAKIKAPVETEFVYKTEQIIFAGWQIVDQHFENESKTYNYICNLKQNIEMPYKKIECNFTLNELKSHYTEARLVQLLEEKGIGRPSTFASLVDKIQSRKYVEKQNITGKTIENSDYILDDTNNIQEKINKKEFGNEKNKLVIQPIGIIVIEFLLSKFDTFFDYDYTKNMEDNLDLVAKGEKSLDKLCSECYKELTNITDSLQDYKKYTIIIDDEHSIIIGKHGPVIKKVVNKDITFIPVKKNLDIDSLKKLDKISIEDVADDKIKSKDAIGKYKGLDLFTKSLKELDIPIDKIEYIDVLHFLEKDTSFLDPSKPIGLIREISSNLSIRTGKYGDYIFYKKPRMKKPEFYKLKDFNGDCRTCDKSLLLNWIKHTYNIE
jgi:DNA topoisomerase I